jgi:hypothetical protein
VEAIVGKLVDIESAALSGGMPKAGSHILQCKGAVRRLDRLKDDSPGARWARNIHFDAAWEPCPRRMLSQALAALVTRHAFSFVALAGGSQRLGRVAVALAVVLKKGVVEARRRIPAPLPRRADGSALVFREHGRAV